MDPEDASHTRDAVGVQFRRALATQNNNLESLPGRSRLGGSLWAIWTGMSLRRVVACTYTTTRAESLFPGLLDTSLQHVAHVVVHLEVRTELQTIIAVICWSFKPMRYAN